MTRHGIALATACLTALAAPGQPLRGEVQLQPETVEAFESYAGAADERFSRQLSGEAAFLWSAQDDARQEALLRGEIVVEPSGGSNPVPVPRGLVHDWTAAMLVPGAKSGDVFAVVTAYDTHEETYAPSILNSEILERDGTRFRVSMRMLRKSVLTAVFETEHLAEYDRLDERRRWGRSRSTSVREVVRPGTEREKLRPPGVDNGYLWRLNTYWRFAETEQGVVAEYRTITLTRGIPRALRWILRPMLTSIPRQSLRDAMSMTRDAALARAR